MRILSHSVLIGCGLLLLSACAPSSVTPAPGGPGYGPALPVFLPTSASARVSKPEGTALGIKLDSVGLGLEVTDGPFGFELKVPPRSGVFARGSFVQDNLVASLSLGWETYGENSGYPDYRYRVYSRSGLGLDAGYYFPIPLESGQGYVGPRLYTYFLCESVDNGPLECVGPRFNPGATIGVNLRFGDRFSVSPEISVFLLPPDEYFVNPRGTTLFGLSLSYRF
jgi:hypothetical protein